MSSLAPSKTSTPRPRKLQAYSAVLFLPSCFEQVIDERSTQLNEVKLLPLKRFGDERGYFCELYQQRRYWKEHELKAVFVQDNLSLSVHPGTVRGLHFQTPPFAQGKLVSVLSGALLDVVVDIRQGSPTYGQWSAYWLNAQSPYQLYVPEGFAHGFCTVEPNTLVLYKVNEHYAPQNDQGLQWNDPALAIPWPVSEAEATLSAKDLKHPRLAELPAYFEYGAAV
jgi:dTDP-4-dehydrorhamnose 3,5-epimerase